MAARNCRGVKGDGTPCRRPPSRDAEYCLAHDPERKDDHAAVSSIGGVARHDPAVLSGKAEIRGLKAALWSGTVSPGAASVLLQAIRLERELDAEERHNDAADGLIESIQSLRDNPAVPDLSEPAQPTTPGGGQREPDEYDREIEAQRARDERYEALTARGWHDLSDDERQELRDERIRRRVADMRR